MNLDNIHSVYLLGIGGIGMSALALYFHKKGAKVSGYDRTRTPLTDKLQDEGIEVHYEDDISRIPDQVDLVIYTPAIPKELGEFQHLNKIGIPVLKRSEVIRLITDNKRTVAVSGTHGKTSVTTMVAHLLTQSNIGCSAFLGGISKNYDSNLLVSIKSDWMVVEADEYDKSFLNLFPQIGIITSIDPDHLDIYGDFENLKASFVKFASQINDGGYLIIKKGINLDFSQLQGITIYQYSITKKADYYAENIRLEGDIYVFDLVTPETKITNLILGIQGLINVENAVAAISAALIAGVHENEIKKALKSFSGIRRRFDYRIKSDNLIYIDDYAHHPEEIKAILSSLKKIYPGKTFLGVFQPHLYSRTRDFAVEFALGLDMLDKVILLPIYPAREKPIEGVTSEVILNHLSNSNKVLCSKDELIGEIANSEFDILLTLGAGDIDQLVQPIQNYLSEPHIKQIV